MNGQFFSTSWFIQPDQIQVINPVLIIFMIPLFEYGIYPVMNKIGLCKKPLQRIVVGGLLASSSFVATGILHQVIESGEPSLPADNQFSITLINGNAHCNLNATLRVQVADETHFEPLPLFMKSKYMIFSGNFVNHDTQSVYLSSDQGNSTSNCNIHNQMIQVHKEQSSLLYLDSTGTFVSILPNVFKHERPEGQVTSLLSVIDSKCHATNQSKCLQEHQQERGEQYLLVRSDRHVHNVSLFDISSSRNSSSPGHSNSHSSSSSSIIQVKSTGPVTIENAALGIYEKSFTFAPGAVDVLIVNCCQVCNCRRCEWNEGEREREEKKGRV